MGGGGGGLFSSKQTLDLVITTRAWWLANCHGNEGLSPTRMLPELLACQSLHHAPLCCRRKWVVGVGPLITSSREHRPPWGMRRVTLLSSLNKIFICYFFSPWLDNSIPTQGGERAHHLSVAEPTKVCPSLQVKHKGVHRVNLHTSNSRTYFSQCFNWLHYNMNVCSVLSREANSQSCFVLQLKLFTHKETHRKLKFHYLHHTICIVTRLNEHSTTDRIWELPVSEGPPRSSTTQTKWDNIITIQTTSHNYNR